MIIEKSVSVSVSVISVLETADREKIPISSFTEPENWEVIWIKCNLERTNNWERSFLGENQ